MAKMCECGQPVARNGKLELRVCQDCLTRLAREFWLVMTGKAKIPGE